MICIRLNLKSTLVLVERPNFKFLYFVFALSASVDMRQSQLLSNEVRKMNNSLCFVDCKWPRHIKVSC